MVEKGKRVITWMLVLVHDDDAAIGKNHLNFDEIVDAEAVHTTEESKATKHHDGRAYRMRRAGTSNEGVGRSTHDSNLGRNSILTMGHGREFHRQSQRCSELRACSLR